MENKILTQDGEHNIMNGLLIRIEILSLKSDHRFVWRIRRECPERLNGTIGLIPNMPNSVCFLRINFVSKNVDSFDLEYIFQNFGLFGHLPLKAK